MSHQPPCVGREHGVRATRLRFGQRRPLFFTPWQRLELRNAVRLAAHRLTHSKGTLRFQVANVLKQIDGDLAAGRLKYRDLDWNKTMRFAQDLSAAHAQDLRAAIHLRADTFWTFDQEQRQLVLATGQIRRVPDLVTQRIPPHA